MTIRAVPTFSADGMLENLQLNFDAESLPSLKNILHRALNTWPDAPPMWKILEARILYGQEFDKAFSLHAISEGYVEGLNQPAPPPEIITEYSNVPIDSIPLCPECGGRGFHHYFKCPTLTKEETKSEQSSD